MLQCVGCGVLQCVAVCWLQSDAVCCSVLLRVAVCCSVLQYVVVYFSVLQCVAVAIPYEDRLHNVWLFVVHKKVSTFV